jgi:hypothetical protein
VTVTLDGADYSVEAGDVGDTPVARLTVHAVGLDVPLLLTRDGAEKLCIALANCFDPDPAGAVAANPPLLSVVAVE